jgi:hypothetical protein
MNEAEAVMTELNNDTFEGELTNAELEAVSGGFIGETVSNKENTGGFNAGFCDTARESLSDGYSHCIVQ